MKAEHSQLIPQKLTENLEVLTALNPIGIITMSIAILAECVKWQLFHEVEDVTNSKRHVQTK